MASPTQAHRGLTNSEVFERSGSQRDHIGERLQLRDSGKRIKYDAMEVRNSHKKLERQSEKSNTSDLSVHSLDPKAPEKDEKRDKMGNYRVLFS
jgi:hypothetical protein